MIAHEWKTNLKENTSTSSYPRIRTMCLRGLLMLLHIEQINDYAFKKLSQYILSHLNSFFAYSKSKADEEHA